MWACVGLSLSRSRGTFGAQNAPRNIGSLPAMDTTSDQIFDNITRVIDLFGGLKDPVARGLSNLMALEKWSSWPSRHSHGSDGPYLPVSSLAQSAGTAYPTFSPSPLASPVRPKFSPAFHWITDGDRLNRIRMPTPQLSPTPNCHVRRERRRRHRNHLSLDGSFAMLALRLGLSWSGRRLVCCL